MINISELLSAYHRLKPDPQVPAQRVCFGTSGHRGSSLARSFNEDHLLVITQAVADWRREQGITGPMFVGRDTHVLSSPALDTVVEVLVANGVEVRLEACGGYTPTPLVSFAILDHNQGAPYLDSGQAGLADGLIITPSHNPPEDGGIKYNGPDGGPAGTDVTAWIERRANELLAGRHGSVQRMSLPLAKKQAISWDFVTPYVEALEQVVDLSAIRSANLKLAVDPMGGAALRVWDAIAERHDLGIDVVNRNLGGDFSFMPPDHDGKIRMDCSSPHAMGNILAMTTSYDLAFGNDPDADRHGIADTQGLMNPNRFLAVCVNYLLSHRPSWPRSLKVGKTLVSSGLIDRMAGDHGHEVYEVPVGFKWFVEGLASGELAFAGEESAGASFLTFNGEPWSTDKDGIVMCLLAAEILAVTGKTPSAYYQALMARDRPSHYRRIDVPATDRHKTRLAALGPGDIDTDYLAGDPIEAVLTHAPGNGAPIGGIKVSTRNGWFAARPSGTEALFKIYAESFVDELHLESLLGEARLLLNT